MLSMNVSRAWSLDQCGGLVDMQRILDSLYIEAVSVRTFPH
uniref:Uncharacterized protein n=1 Tax=Arundo donax TaxID=35708 RepID=A0A0A9GWI4_ARUDO